MLKNGIRQRLIQILLLLLFAKSPAKGLIITKEGEAYQQSYGVPASMLPQLPSGHVLKLFTSPNSGLLGGTVWPAAKSLCTCLLENQQSLDLQSARCVELGSGTGAVGLFCAGLGAHVILTDCCPPPESAMYTTDGTPDLPSSGSGAILELLKRNVEANDEDMFPNDDIFPNNRMPQVMELDWTKPLDRERVAAEGEVDIVLASDVTHFSLMHEPLACTIARLMRRNGGICLLAHQERMINLKGQDMQLYEFEQVARSKGLHVEHLPLYTQTKSQQQERLRLSHGSSDTRKDARISMLLLRHDENSAISPSGGEISVT